MTPNRDELYELQERIAKLTPDEQLMLAQHILGGIRRKHFFDHEAYQRAIRADFDAVLAHEAARRAANDPDTPPEQARVAG
jgi:hypothetical protein